MMRKLLLALFIAISLHSMAQIRLDKFAADYIPTGFHAITAENGFIIVTFPESKGIWKSHCYSPDGITKWETVIELQPKEYIIQDELHNGILNIFSTIKNEDTKEAVLYVRSLNEETGKIIKERELWRTQINVQHFNNDKADVVADENMSLIALRSDKVEVHLEYRFNLTLSKDASKLLFYIYDYSQPQLKMHYKIYDREVNELHDGNVDLDDGNFIYDIRVNSLGDIFIANSNLDGDIEVYRLPFKTDEFDLLNITAENTVRDDLTLVFTDDNRVYVVCKSEIDERFYGVHYALMDFEKKEIVRVHFEPVTLKLKKTVDSLHRAGIIPHIVWTKYNLTHVNVFNDNELFVVYEHMETNHSGHIFREIDFVSRLPWKEHKSKISVGPAIMFSFDSYDALRWAKYFDFLLETDEAIFPLSSAMYVQDPEGDKITHLISENLESYTYDMDYIYDRTENKNLIVQKGRLIPAWTVKMDGKYYMSYYDKDDKSLTIQVEK